MRNRKGFTLVELVVSMGITTLLLGAVYLAVNSTQRNSAGIERKVLAQQDVKPALELMAMEITMASYNPNCTRGNWRNDTCTGASPNPTYRGIQEATATSITIQMDTNADCTADNLATNCLGGANEVIRYDYVATTGTNPDRYITRGTGCAAGQPFLGDNIADGRPRNVRVINNDYNPVIPIFRYFNGSGTEIAATALPASIPDIRRILITLAVETENPDPNTGHPKRLIYSTSVIPRNHVTEYRN